VAKTLMDQPQKQVPGIPIVHNKLRSLELGSHVGPKNRYNFFKDFFKNILGIFPLK
jgi:hypothetical protein